MSKMMDEAISRLLVGPSPDLSCVMRSQPHECHDKEIDKVDMIRTLIILWRLYLEWRSETTTMFS